MHPALEILLTILFFLIYPVYWIVYWAVLFLYQALGYVLRFLYSVLLFVLQPVISAAVFIGHLAYIPIDLIKRFETIYIYLGVGIFVGIVAGVILHLAFRILTHLLGLGKETVATSDTYKRETAANESPKIKEEFSPDLVSDSPYDSQQTRMFALPALRLESPSPQKRKGRRTLLEQTLDEDGYESDL